MGTQFALRNQSSFSALNWICWMDASQRDFVHRKICKNHLNHGANNTSVDNVDDQILVLKLEQPDN